VTRSLITVSLFFSVSCTDYKAGPRNPFIPTPSDIDNGWVDISAWSPYMVIQPADSLLRPYIDAISPLIKNGNLKGARIEIVKNQGVSSVIKDLSMRGVEILGIVDNYFLIDDSERMESIMDNIIRIYPEIRYFQIGNEITSLLPNSPRIDMRQYMEIFKRIYRHVINRYPHIILVTQATIGTGSYGSRELNEMAEYGLSNMDPSRVIIGINIYAYLSRGQSPNVLNTNLRRFRVWITETGIKDPSKQIPYMQESYPEFRNILRAERIYWYALYAGQGQDWGFSLIDIEHQPILKNPLYRVLENYGYRGAI
jgi:hypothetical protein